MSCDTPGATRHHGNKLRQERDPTIPRRLGWICVPSCSVAKPASVVPFTALVHVRGRQGRFPTGHRPRTSVRTDLRATWRQIRQPVGTSAVDQTRACRGVGRHNVVSRQHAAKEQCLGRIAPRWRSPRLYGGTASGEQVAGGWPFAKPCPRVIPVLRTRPTVIRAPTYLVQQ